MKSSIWEKAERFLRERKKDRRWLAVFVCLAVVVALGTLTAVKYTGSAMTRDVLDCSYQIHKHTQDCYDAEHQLICGYADFVIHKHSELCYDSEGKLVCTLPEVELHQQHESSCYTEQSVLVCTLPESSGHTHSEDCYTSERGEQICGQEEHTHGEGCYDETGALVCAVEEHVHSDACYTWNQVLSCGQEESQGHTHGDACYQTQQVLTCTKFAQALHTHDEKCYDKDGQLICGLLQLEEHIHTEACLKPEEGTQPEESTEESTEESVEENGNAGAEESLTETLAEENGETGETDSSDALTAPAASVLNSDQARVSQLIATDVKVIPGEEETIEEAETEAIPESSIGAEAAAALAAEVEDSESTLIATVRNQDQIQYSFRVCTESDTEISYSEGRIRMEFVLPLTAEQASFDLSAMSWLDQTEGYAPVLTTELRKNGETEVTCQVLTGYLLLSQTEGGSAIPGEYSENVTVSLHNAPNGERIVMQISAAMEFGVWDGECEIHQREEKLTTMTSPLRVVLSAKEQEQKYESFVLEIEALEALGEIDEEHKAAAELLLQNLEEAFRQGELSEAGFSELYERAYLFIYGDPNTMAEAAIGTNWIILRDSGWFEEYSEFQSVNPSSSNSTGAVGSNFRSCLPMVRVSVPNLIWKRVEARTQATLPSSQTQVVNEGGSQTSADENVTVSKTISGTDLENVFDITLQVQTPLNLDEINKEPDMAVVIVMDISHTMNSNFGSNTRTRYTAAMEAAEDFLDQFAANNSLGISKVGYVAFNTDAHQIFSLQPCATQAAANSLKNTMRMETGSIISATGYSGSHSRFTNIQAGLKMARDMLANAQNKNKYIIFLSDGFPTTYIESGYRGYDPYDSGFNRFYDTVLNKTCSLGTSYSDEAAIRARKMATEVKNSGITIFSIGVDVAGQTIQKYIDASVSLGYCSLVDRRGTTYEIGAASSTTAYKNWLKNKIGSGYYYDSTDTAGLKAAYNEIFQKMKEETESKAATDWVTVDPIPSQNGVEQWVEFIGFYDKAGNVPCESLSGRYASDAENTASFDSGLYAIRWDLKKSGYQVTTSSGKDIYTYQLKYRVRLKNEANGFVENEVYPTNGTTTLTYRNIVTTNGTSVVSDPKTVDFPIPSVKGYLSELNFLKVDNFGNKVSGAEFTLSHDTQNCSICRGDSSTAVAITDQKAISDTEGKVSFTLIPSGHKYTLTETKVPNGYSATQNTYQVTVAYDQLSVTVTAYDGTTSLEWNGKIENRTFYELPATGGPGTAGYTMGGLALMAIAAASFMYKYRKRQGA